MRPRLLTIAGSDPSGGAGIQADLKVFSAHGAHGMAAVAALTVQDTRGVAATLDLPPEFVAAEVRTLLADIGCDAAKTGMLGSSAVVEAVAAVLREHPVPRLVVDPVLASTSGRRLLAEDGEEALRRALLPLAAVVTPNLAEASRLAGFEVASREAMREAARAIAALGPRAVLVKGGHLPGAQVVDVLYDADSRSYDEVASPRIETPHTHGTGCVLSAAIACRLARGEPVARAARGAQAYVRAAIRAAVPIGHGRGSVDPLAPEALRAARPEGPGGEPAT